MNARPGRLHLWLLALFALLLPARSALSQSSRTIQGTVYAAPGNDVSNTVVIACVVVKDECSDTLSKVAVIKDTGSSAPYRLEDVGAGPFLMIAWRDLNSTGEVDAGDEVGVYSQDAKQPALVSPPASKIDLRLKAFTGDLDALLANIEGANQTQPTPAPSPPQASGSIVGDWSTVELFADAVNADTGSYVGGNNSFTAAKFDAKGNYTLTEYIYITKNTGCTDWIFTATTGTYGAEPKRIAFAPKTSNQIYQSGCQPSTSYKRKSDPRDLGPFRYWWKLELDRDGLEVLSLLRSGQSDWFYADHLHRKK